MKVALVTGVSSGIGSSTAAILAGAGFRTFGTVRSEAARPAPNVELVRVDVRDDAAVRSGVQEVLDRTGRIDVLVNCAGAALFGALEETSLDEARELFDTNFFGAVRMNQAVLPAMRRQGSGRLITIGSILGFLPAPFMGMYAATKFALEGYSETLDHEIRNLGVRAVLVEPGYTRTGLSEKYRTAQASWPDYAADRATVVKRVNDNIANGVDPEVVARVVLRAATARTPRLRYTAGSEAATLAMLRAFAPASILDRGIRKAFGLGAAS